jgi:UDP-3-O-[3-hydroxymyristoyl] glucosamine N-acyltransferase
MPESGYAGHGRQSLIEITLSDLLIRLDGDIIGDSSRIIRGAAPFHEAGGDDITFADSAGLLKKIAETRAGAVLVPRSFAARTEACLLRTDNPRLAFARIMPLFFHRPGPAPGIAVTAVIGRRATIGRDVSIGHYTVIGENSRIGDRSRIHPGVIIGDGVQIGQDTEIYPNVTIYNDAQIGSRVIIQAGCVIGSDGYGFVADGEQQVKIPQVGIVVIDDDVEIGACNTIDRATFGKTWIKRGVKTDNHVHIAHNVVVGENTLIVAQVGIAGSTTIGRNVIMAGQAGIGGHITIGDRAIVGPQAGVARSLPAGAVVSGTPEMPHPLWLRVHQIIPRLPELKKRIADIEKRLDQTPRPGQTNQNRAPES